MTRHPQRYPELHDPAWLRAQVAAGANTLSIARIVGCSQAGAAWALRQHGIQILKRCNACGETFGHNDYRAHIRTCKCKVAAPTTCPHCGERVAAAGMPKHVAHCFHNPAVREFTRSLVDDGTGAIVTRNVYMERRNNSTAITYEMLRQHYRTWPQVAAVFGLLDRRDTAERRQLAMLEDEAKAVQLERIILELEKDRGLAVCSVRQVGHEVYCMLR